MHPAKFYAASSENDQEFTRIAMLFRDLYGKQHRMRGKTDLVMKDVDVANFLQACAHLLLNYEPLFTADKGDGVLTAKVKHQKNSLDIFLVLF